MRGPAPEKVEVVDTTGTSYTKLTPLKVPIPGSAEESKDGSGQQLQVYDANSQQTPEPDGSDPGTPKSTGPEHSCGETSGEDEGLTGRKSEVPESPPESKTSQAIVVHGEKGTSPQEAIMKALEAVKASESTEEPPAVSQVTQGERI